jgi:hypothetical protein
MTLAEGKLLAISGIATVFAKGLDTSQYKAGIWFSQEEQHLFLLDLLWHVQDRKPIQNTHSTQPSWSWAAVEGGVDWPRDGANTYARSKDSITCRALECTVDIQFLDLQFDNVKSGTLKVSGL